MADSSIRFVESVCSISPLVITVVVVGATVELLSVVVCMLLVLILLVLGLLVVEVVLLLYTVVGPDVTDIVVDIVGSLGILLAIVSALVELLWTVDTV